MAKFSLRAEPFLGGFKKDYDTVIIEEVTDRAITSLALPLGGEGKAEKAIKSALKLNLPKVGASTLSKDGETALLRLGKDQLFCLMEGESDGHAAHKALKDKFTENFSGKKVVILGGTGPVGVASAVISAKAGNDVLLVGRSLEKAETIAGICNDK